MSHGKIPKTTKTRPILAKHAWETYPDGSPIYKTFSQRVWGRMVSMPIPDKKLGESHPKGGWEKVDPKALETPPEANEAKATGTAKKGPATKKA